MNKVMYVKITGIIAEYNPLHAGHLYQLSEARRRSGCDYIVVALGGAFTQRGEAALFDKFARVRMALSAGADAVFELSCVYAARCAQLFARGGTGVLTALGCDALSFGCESEDLSLLYRASEGVRAMDKESAALLHDRLAQGESYPRALATAIAGGDEALFHLMAQPNFILALEYINELKRRGASMSLCPVKRTSPYHEPTLSSATGIRTLLKEGQTEAVLGSLPDDIAQIYLAQMPDGMGDMRRLDALMLNELRRTEPGSVVSPDEAEGLFRRLQTCARHAASFEEALAQTKCKRYTLSRIRRLALDAALHLPGAPEEVPYLRLLGARREAAPLMKELKKRARLPVVSRAALLKGDPVFEAECCATDLWGLSTQRREYRLAGREFTTGLIRT